MSSGKEKDLKKVSLDSILIKELGQFGRYQLITLFLVSLPTLFWTFGVADYVFTTARIPSRCLIPECDGADPVFAAPWRDVAIPQLASGAFDQCSRFGSNSSNTWTIQDASCLATLFDTSVTQRCEQLVYQHNNTVVSEFNLGCNEWQRSLIGSIKVMGTLVSLPITGYVSDRWGRRIALAINTFNSGCLGLIVSFTNSYSWFLSFAVAEVILGYGIYTCCYIIAAEMVGPKYRVLTGTIITSVLSVGHGLLGLLAWAVPYWRSFVRVIYIPQLFFISYIWILSESVRWLMSKGRYGEAENILKKVAECNKKSLSVDSLVALQASSIAEKDKIKTEEPWLPILLFKSPQVLVRCCIIVPIWWITNMFTYYGMTVNSVNLSGNSYLNYSLAGFIDLPGRWTTYLLMDRVGRKRLIFVSYIICSACQFAFAFLPDGIPSLSTTVYMIGKICIAAITTAVPVYSVELTPTVHRHKLYAFASMVGRLGTITAPLTPSLAQEVWSPLPSVLFGSFALVSALLVLVTPETLGAKLPETMEDAVNIGKNNT